MTKERGDSERKAMFANIGKGKSFRKSYKDPNIKDGYRIKQKKEHVWVYKDEGVGQLHYKVADRESAEKLINNLNKRDESKELLADKELKKDKRKLIRRDFRQSKREIRKLKI